MDARVVTAARWARGAVAAALLGAGAIGCADAVRPPDGADVVAGDPSDVPAFDAPAGCGEGFVVFTYRAGDAAPRTVCAPLANGGIVMNFMWAGGPAFPCPVASVVVTASFNGRDEFGVGVLGPTLTFAARERVLVSARVALLSNGDCDATGPLPCVFGSAAYDCPFEVLRTGSLGELVAARSLATCALRTVTPTGEPVRTLALSDVYVQGRLIRGQTISLFDGAVCD